MTENVKKIISFKYFLVFTSVFINITAIFLISISLSDKYDIQIKNIELPSETSIFAKNKILNFICDTVLSTTNMFINITNVLPMIPLMIAVSLITLAIIIKLYSLSDNYKITLIPSIFSTVITLSSTLFCIKYLTFNSENDNTILNAKIFKIVREDSIESKKLHFTLI